MAKILNLETATTNCSVSIAADGKLLTLVEENTPNYSHSEQLHLFIEEALKKASFSFSDLDAVAVSKGPGSYTGLRIGVSAAKGLCFALDIPLISIPTLESLANQLTVGPDDVIISLLDARRMEVYSAVYDHDHRKIRSTEAEVVESASFSEYQDAKTVFLVGPGAEKCKEVLSHPNFSYSSSNVPSAKEMALLSFKKYLVKEFEDVAYFEPYYLKDFVLQQKKKKS